MTEHKATPGQWDRLERYANEGGYYDSCLLELRARVEALEAAAKPAESNYLAEPDSSLVERVDKAMWAGESAPDARAAIREVAAWLRFNTDLVYGPHCARWIEQKLDKLS